MTDHHAPPPAPPGWDAPDWPEPVLHLVDTALRQAGLRRTGPPVPIRRWTISAVLQVPTDHGNVWFKQVPAVFAHEGAVMRWVAQHHPAAVPRVIGTGPGWTMSEHLPVPVGTPRGHPLATLARIQRDTVGRTGELLRLGCPERPLDGLVADTEALTRRTDLLGPRQARALRRALPRFAALVREAAAAGLPATLVHGDVQPENALWADGRWMFIDWTDSGIGHPFVDLARPLLNASAAQRAAATAEVATVWAGVAPPDALAAALRAAPALGAAYQAEGHRRIVDAVGPGDGFLELLRGWVRLLLAAVQDTPHPAATAGAAR